MRSTVSQLPATEEEVRVLVGQIRQAESLPWPPRAFRVVPVVGEPLANGMLEMARRYEAWCEERGQGHDCSGALKDKPYIDAEGRYRIAFDIALRNEWSGFASEMRGMTRFENVKVVLLTAMVIYMATLAIPELTTKFVAAGITMVLTAYLGAQAVWDLVIGWIEMVKEANVATTFAQLVAAGEKYGEKVGAQIARVLVMVVTAAIAEGGLVARVLNLPKASEAAVALSGDSGRELALGEVGQVRGAAVAGSHVTVVIAPAGEVAQGALGVAMAARGSPVSPVKCRVEDHHIATIENSRSTLRGGPWTTRYQALFDKADLSMRNKANVVSVWAHRGPHPLEYHQYVYDYLSFAMKDCQTTLVCREKLVGALRELAAEIAKTGSYLNNLVTRGCGARE